MEEGYDRRWKKSKRKRKEEKKPSRVNEREELSPESEDVESNEVGTVDAGAARKNLEYTVARSLDSNLS